MAEVSVSFLCLGNNVCIRASPRYPNICHLSGIGFSVMIFEYPLSKTNRLNGSFYPVAIRTLNDT